MRKPNGESHTYACVTERQLSGKQFSIMYIRKRPIAVTWVLVVKLKAEVMLLTTFIYNCV